MKKSIFIVVIAAFMIGAFAGCKKAAKEEVKVSPPQEQTLEEKVGKLEKQAEITEEEWHNFKNEMEAELKANEAMINALKADVKKSGKKYDAAYLKKVDTIEKKHVQLRSEVDKYDKNQKEWDKFKSRVKSDVDAIGKELNDLRSGKKK